MGELGELAAGALICLTCRGRMSGVGTTALACDECKARITFADGIVDVLGADSELTPQEHHYDEGVDVAWETWRPAGAPMIHRWLLEDKLVRAISLAQVPLRGASVLDVCSGSGMDAEFLFDRGAQVVLVDISRAALERAATRLSARGHQATYVRARAEQLPFRDRSFDIAVVHDGLHHLPEPDVAVRELARVAARAVVVLEPARSVLTQIAVKLGLALEVEEAGNVVRRFRADEITAWLEAYGLCDVVWSRRLLRQTHWPTRAQRLLSASAILPLARLAYAAFATVPGSLVGNKLTVVGRRCDR